MLAVAMAQLPILNTGAAGRSAPAASSAGALAVSVGYAEDKESNTPNPAAYPVPWNGSSGVTFIGNPVPGQNTCGSLVICYDAGAIRLDNPSSSAVNVDSVSVDEHSAVSGGHIFSNLWGSFTVAAGGSVILTENPPANDPSYDNFDTSGYPSNNCTPIAAAPKVTVTIGGVATVLADSAHVLDTGGIDSGYCAPKRNESLQWRPIGSSGGASASLALGSATVTRFAGQTVAETATLQDGSGVGLPHVSVAFAVKSGPDAGTTGSAVTDASGNASFTYAGAAEGEDIVVATVTSVGSFSSNQASVLWTDDNATGWTGTDVGAATPAGSQSLDSTTGTWTIAGGGTGFGSTSDQLRFVSKSVTSGGIGVHVVSQTSTLGATAGVMLRTDTGAGSAYYAATISAGHLTVRMRTASNAVASVVTSAATAPPYLWITDSSGTLRTYTSTDGYSWTPLSGSAATLNLGTSYLAGITVTSQSTTQLNSATADSVVVGSSVPPPSPPVACPAPWNCAAIGNPNPAGTQSYDANSATWTISAGGSDISNASDQFRFVYQSLSGNGSIRVRVVTQSNTSVTAKAGVMLRLSTDPASPNYAVVVTPGTGIKVQERSVQGGLTTKIANPAGQVPAYLEVARSGNTFTAYTSADGIHWTLIPGSTYTMNVPATLLEGLAMTSHSSGVLGTVTMDSLTLS